METISFSGRHSFQYNPFLLVVTIPYSRNHYFLVESALFSQNYSFQWKPFVLVEVIPLVEAIPLSGSHSFQRKPFPLMEAIPFSGSHPFQWKPFLFVEAIPFSRSHYELRPKKWVFGSGGWTKNNTDYQQPQDVYFLEKYDELSELVAFGPKLRYFTDQNGAKAGPHENEF